jgi:hypothetical protein
MARFLCRFPRKRATYAGEPVLNGSANLRVAGVRMFPHAIFLSSEPLNGNPAEFWPPFWPYYRPSSLVFIPAARNNPLGLGFFNATSS